MCKIAWIRIQIWKITCCLISRVVETATKVKEEHEKQRGLPDWLGTVFESCLACSAGDKLTKKCQRDMPVVLFGQKSEGKL